MHRRHLVEVFVSHGEMHVGVEEPGQEALPPAVDADVPVQPRSDGGDPAVLDQHVGLRERRASAVEHSTACQHDPHDRSPLSWRPPS